MEESWAVECKKFLGVESLDNLDPAKLTEMKGFKAGWFANQAYIKLELQKLQREHSTKATAVMEVLESI